MLLPRALLVPHWPTLLEDELRRHRTPMLEALSLEARRFVAERPEIAVVMSAHWESSGPFHVGSARFHRTRTDDPAFGVESRYDCAGHPELARTLIAAGAAAQVRVGPSDRGIDGGVTVPMHFLAPGRGIRVVPLSTARRPLEECRRWGAAIRSVLAVRPERIGLVMGGMLSHATHAWNFRREVPEARQLDQAVLEALRAGDWSAIGPVADKWKDRAHPEAGLVHLEVLRGFLGADLAGEVLCYEAGPGMGAALVAFPVPEAISVASPEALLPEPAPVLRVSRGGRPGSPIGREPRPAGPRRTGPRSGEPRRNGRREGLQRRTGERVGMQRREGGRPAPQRRTGTRVGMQRREGGRPAPQRRTGTRVGMQRREGGGPAPQRRDGTRAATTRPRFADQRAVKRGSFANARPKRARPPSGASAGSRTPRPRGRAPMSRPARKPRG